jgi:hypothetical protein
MSVRRFLVTQNLLGFNQCDQGSLVDDIIADHREGEDVFAEIDKGITHLTN